MSKEIMMIEQRKVWPAAEFLISPENAERMIETYQRSREAFAREVSINCSPEQLDKLLGPIPHDLAKTKAFGAWLGGSYLGSSNWVGLCMLADVFPATDQLAMTGRIEVPMGQTRVFAGEVVIDGDLIVHARANVVVLGTLTMTGSLVALENSLVAVGNLRCQDGVTQGSLLALETIRCPGKFLLKTYGEKKAKQYIGGTLVNMENSSTEFRKVRTSKQVSAKMHLVDHDAMVKALDMPWTEVDDSCATDWAIYEAFVLKLLGALPSPVHPETVPPEATWSHEEKEWSAGEKNADNQPVGVWSYWRADGSPLCVEIYCQDRVFLTFQRFHEDGSVAQEGKKDLQKDILVEMLRWLRADVSSEEDEYFPSRSEEVRSGEVEFDQNGLAFTMRWFNRQGEAVDVEGKLLPPKPAGLPDRVYFDVKEDAWVQGQYRMSEKGLQGVGEFSLWNRDGVFMKTKHYGGA